MEIKVNTLALVRRPVNRLDIGVVERIHQTAPVFELRTILKKSLRCYQCNLIPISKMPDGINDIEEAVEKLCPYPQLRLIEKIKGVEKFTEEEIKLIQEILSIDPNKEPIEGF